jgi:hypothetical protein
MKTTILAFLLILMTASCSGWGIQPGPFNPPTPFLPPTNTPSVFTATPVVIGASATSTPKIATSTPIPFITATTAPTIDFPTFVPTDTPVTVVTQTNVPSGPAVSVEILGCNTSVDVTHGMGEVTNAYVVLRNTGMIELTNLRVTLHALDEGREHPDKTVEVASLLAGYKVMLKLTVDSTYQAETPVQVEISADGGLFQRVGSDSCRDIGLFAPNPGELGTPVPNNP